MDVVDAEGLVQRARTKHVGTDDKEHSTRRDGCETLFCFFCVYRRKRPRTYGSFPIIFRCLPRCAFCSANSLHCTVVSGFSPFALRELLKHLWHKMVVYDSSPPSNHHGRQLPMAERPLAALLVTTKHHLLRNTYRTWYKKPSLPLLPFSSLIASFT